MKATQVGLPHLPIHPNGVTRRTLLNIGVAGFLNTLLPSLARGEMKPPYSLPLPSLLIPSEIVPIPGRNPIPVILIWCDGGLSNFDTFDPKPHASSNVKGYFDAIRTKKGTLISETIPNLARVVDDTLILRKVFTTGIPDHPDQRTHFFTGSPEVIFGNTAVRPSLTARLQDEVLKPSGDMGLVVINANNTSNPDTRTVQPQGSLGVKYSNNKDGYPSPFGDQLDRDRFEARLNLREKIFGDENNGLRTPQTKRYETLIGSAAKALEGTLGSAFDLSKVDEATREKFGINPMGNACLTAMQLVRGGTQFVKVHYGFWDHHYFIEKEMKGLVPPFDQAVSALIEEMKDEAIIVVASEFGRTPKLNEGFPNVNPPTPPGRDHWIHSSSILLAGPGINSGVIGQTDEGGFIKGNDGEFHMAHSLATILKLAGYELRWKDGKKPFPTWPIS